jgi:hypothetical protein
MEIKPKTISTALSQDGVFSVAKWVNYRNHRRYDSI